MLQRRRVTRRIHSFGRTSRQVESKNAHCWWQSFMRREASIYLRHAKQWSVISKKKVVRRRV